MAENFTTKEMLVALMTDMREVRDGQIRQTEKLIEIEGHAKFTNGKIAKAITDIDELETKMYLENRNTRKSLIKYGITALLFASFVFIEESRDFILSALGIF